MKFLFVSLVFSALLCLSSAQYSRTVEGNTPFSVRSYGHSHICSCESTGALTVGLIAAADTSLKISSTIRGLDCGEPPKHVKSAMVDAISSVQRILNTAITIKSQRKLSAICQQMFNQICPSSNTGIINSKALHGPVVRDTFLSGYTLHYDDTYGQELPDGFGGFIVRSKPVIEYSPVSWFSSNSVFLCTNAATQTEKAVMNGATETVLSKRN